MDIPEPSNLDGFEGEKLNYFLGGDEIYLLQEWLIKPYSKSALTSEMKQTSLALHFQYVIKRWNN